jgi:Flp pilus assembly pilin Flp
VDLRKKEKKMKILWRFLKDERGLETAEWALLLGIVVLTATIAAVAARPAIQTIFEEMGTELTDAAAGVTGGT